MIRPGHWWFVWLGAFLLGLVPAQGAERVLANFDDGPPGRIAAPGFEARIGRDRPAAGKGYLQLDRRADAKGNTYVRLWLPQGADLDEHAAVAAAVRAAGPEKLDLRWLALNEKNQILFQQRVTLEPTGEWQAIESPFYRFRWANDLVGDWSEVKSLALMLESPASRLSLDEVRLTAAKDDVAERTVELIRKLAFEDRPVRIAREPGGLVATDAPEVFSDADLQGHLSRMLQARAAVKRMFGRAVRPANPEIPMMLLIFRQRDDQKVFFERLGAEWAVHITPPTSGGYTVQDIATSTYDPKQGVERPVYLHESVHAIVARDLRLSLNDAVDHWLHEGVASYVQVSVYPRSLDRQALAKAFAQGVDAQGRSFFKPLAQITSARVSESNYAQLATVVAFLAEEKPQWLEAIALAQSDGKSLAQALGELGTATDELQALWLEWGRRRYANEGDGRVFPPLPEWKQAR